MNQRTRTQREVTDGLTRHFGSTSLMLTTPIRALVMLAKVDKPLFRDLVTVGVDSDADEGLTKLDEVAKTLSRITFDFDVSGKRPKNVPKESEHQCLSGYIRFGRLGKGDDFVTVLPFSCIPVGVVRDFCTDLLQDQVKDGLPNVQLSGQEEARMTAATSMDEE